MAELSTSQAIRNRRTTKEFDGSPLTTSQIENLLDLANLAPNHRLNYPWRFFVLTQESIRSFLEKIKKDLPEEELKASQKYFEKLPRVGAIIFVGSQKNSDTVVQEENFAAVSAAIQNVLLAATAQDLQSFWSTGKFFKIPTVLKSIGWTDDLQFAGCLWLGKGAKVEAKPRKSVSEFTSWVSF